MRGFHCYIYRIMHIQYCILFNTIKYVSNCIIFIYEGLHMVIPNRGPLWTSLWTIPFWPVFISLSRLEPLLYRDFLASKPKWTLKPSNVQQQCNISYAAYTMTHGWGATYTAYDGWALTRSMLLRRFDSKIWIM